MMVKDALMIVFQGIVLYLGLRFIPLVLVRLFGL